MTHKELINKIGNITAVKLENISKLADNRNLNIKVRAKDNSFTIFVYDKSIKSSYMVGFDGNFNSNELNFEYCLEQTRQWIEEYKSFVY